MVLFTHLAKNTFWFNPHISKKVVWPRKIFLFVFQDFSMLALVDDFITLHFTLNTIRIREKGIIIGNELIFRRETLDTFDPKYKVMY